MTRRSLMFDEYPVVEFGSVVFQDVHVVLQHEKTPLIYVVHEPAVGYTIAIRAYRRDGTHLATAEGEHLIATAEGKKAGVTLRRRDAVTVCEVDGQTLFEMRRIGADRVKLSAEMYAPSGQFIVANDDCISMRSSDGEIYDSNEIGGGGGMSNMFIAILMKTGGGVEIGYDAPPVS